MAVSFGNKTDRPANQTNQTKRSETKRTDDENLRPVLQHVLVTTLHAVELAGVFTRDSLRFDPSDSIPASYIHAQYANVTTSHKVTHNYKMREKDQIWSLVLAVEVTVVQCGVHACHTVDDHATTERLKQKRNSAWWKTALARATTYKQMYLQCRVFDVVFLARLAHFESSPQHHESRTDGHCEWGGMGG